jgi:hypothetical protein
MIIYSTNVTNIIMLYNYVLHYVQDPAIRSDGCTGFGP